MNTVRLYGALAKEFGPEHRFEIASPAEAVQALAANFPRFIDKLRGGFFRVVIGKSASKGIGLDENTILSRRLGDQTLHIVPVTKGSKSGLGKVLAGILLIGLSLSGLPFLAAGIGAGGTVTMGAITGQIGLGLTLTGAASLLSPEMDGSENSKSFTMTGPQITLREGGIVPIVYGEVWTGGTMISGQLKVENALTT
jgi:predicted phage tail protein